MKARENKNWDFTKGESIQIEERDQGEGGEKGKRGVVTGELNWSTYVCPCTNMWNPLFCVINIHQ